LLYVRPFVRRRHNAAAEEVRAGELGSSAALDALLVTVVDLLAGRRLTQWPP